MTQDHSYTGGLWIRSNCGINLPTSALVVSIQQMLPKQLNTPCLPQPAGAQAVTAERLSVGREWGQLPKQ